MPSIALLIGIISIWWLFKQDRKLRQFSSTAIWIPTIWLVTICSRSPGHWLHSLGLYQMGSADSETSGNIIDSIYFFGIITLSFVALQRQQFSWREFGIRNKILISIYLYFLCSSIWADYSGTTAKRVIKDFANVLVALILVSDRQPLEMVRAVYVRTAYILLPLSLIFIKFFPSIGRVPNRSGSNLFGGVTTHKNALGLVVFSLCIAIILDLIALRKERGRIGTNIHEHIRYLMLLLGVCLLIICDSKTALLCLILGGSLFLFSSLLTRFSHPGRIVAFSIVLASVAVVANETFDVSGKVLAMLGRDPTLTGRTEIWKSVLAAPTNPLLGCGFYSFWSTEMAKPIQEPFGEQRVLNTAHNGFIETYLDGGLIGLCLLIALLIFSGWHNLNRVVAGELLGRFGLVLWSIISVYSISETAFFRISPLWFSLILISIEYTREQFISTSTDFPNRAPAFPRYRS